MALPNEEKVRRLIKHTLAAELALCDRLLDFGIGLHAPEIIDCSRLRADTVTVVMGLFTKACLTYRSIIALCEAGLDRSAAPASRSLFETFMNLTFLVRRRVTLCRFGNGKKTAVKFHGKNLDVEFRTALYCITLFSKIRRWLLSGRRRRGSNAGKGVHDKLAALPSPHVGHVGPDWESKLRESNTCAGISVSDLAASLGRHFYMIYRSLYAFDSQSVHQTDALHYIQVDEEAEAARPLWFTSPDESRQMLHRSSMIFLGCAEELHKRFRFGNEAEKEIREIAAALKRWKLRSPARVQIGPSAEIQNRHGRNRLRSGCENRGQRSTHGTGYHIR